MTQYLEVALEISNPQLSEVLIAELSEMGYDSFEDKGKLINAYIEEKLYEEADLKLLLNKYKDTFQCTYSIGRMEDKNWNEEWESNFKAVQVDDFCLIRASFHQANPSIKHEIVIEPKMAFGTGHHESTYLMIQMMKDISFENKSVLDFGCGTGVLAIMANKLGATNIIAIDNNPWAFESTKENIRVNNASIIGAYLNDENFLKNKQYDIVLANLCRNVLLETIHIIALSLKEQSVLLTSGILAKDESLIEKVAKENRLLVDKKEYKGDWVSIQFSKS